MAKRFDPLLLSETVLGFGRTVVALLRTLHEHTSVLGKEGWYPITLDNGLLEVDGALLAQQLAKAGVSAHRTLHIITEASTISERWQAIDARLVKHPRLPAGTRMAFSVYVTRNPGLLEGRAELTCGGASAWGRLIMGAAVAALAERVALADKARLWSSRSLESFTVTSSEHGTHVVEAPGPRQALVADRFLNWNFIPSGTTRVVRDTGGTIVASHRT